MQDIKERATRKLRQQSAERAMGFLEDCDVHVAHVTRPEGSGPMQMDVLLHCDGDAISQAQSSGAASAIEDAIREAVPGTVRHLQWTETEPLNGPSAGRGVGQDDGMSDRAVQGTQPPKPINDDPGKSGDRNTNRPGDAPALRRDH